MGIGVEPGYKMAGATYLSLFPRLRMSGAIPIIPPFVFMAWTRTTSFYFTLASTSQRNQQMFIRMNERLI
jgi:hypothetical protein